MTRPSTDCVTHRLSSLQRRLLLAAVHPAGHDWVSLVENVPEWPASTVAAQSGAVAPLVPLRYPPTQGHEVLREAVAGRVHEGVVDVDNLVVTGGAMHAIGLLARDLAARGYRQVVCTAPVFAGVAATMRAAGLRVEPLLTDDIVADPSMLGRACSHGDVLYLNLPHNPTGAVLTPALQQVLADLVRGSEVTVIYDAVYDAYDFSDRPARTPTCLALETPRFAVVNSMSKNYGRPGDRIGWIVGHRRLVERLLPRLEWECVAVSGVAQELAAAALYRGNAALVDVVRGGRGVVAELTDFNVPLGGTQCWQDLGLEDIEEFADFAMREHGVILATGSNYVPMARGHIRFPTGIPADRIRTGNERIRAALAAWTQRPGVAGARPRAVIAAERR